MLAEKQKEKEKLRLHIGRCLAELLREKQMTQRELARRLEVDKSVISNYCGGKILPKLSELIEIAKIFEVSLDYLAGIEKIPAESIGKSLTEIGFSEKTTKALKQLDEVDKALIEKVLMHGLISGLSHKTNRKESE